MFELRKTLVDQLFNSSEKRLAPALLLDGALRHAPRIMAGVSQTVQLAIVLSRYAHR